MLEDPAQEPPPYVYQRTIAPEEAPDKATIVTIGFKHGDPVSIDGKTLSPAALLTRLNELGRDNGIGRVDLVENRFVGMKSRGIYETPGGTILHVAHRAIESLTLDREAMHLKDSLMPRYAELVYYGFWFAPEREMLQALVDKSQEHVEGEVTLKLYKGNVIVIGRASPKSLYSDKIVTFEDDAGAYDQKDAAGFIKLNALRLRLLGKRREQQGLMISACGLTRGYSICSASSCRSSRRRWPIRRGVDMAVAVAEAGALGSFPCAALTTTNPRRRRHDQVAHEQADQSQLSSAMTSRSKTLRVRRAWLERLAPYYDELGAEMPQLRSRPRSIASPRRRAPWSRTLRPGDRELPFRPAGAPICFARVKPAGCKIISSATTLREAHVSRRARRRCDHRARGRGRRPSRHVPRDRRRDAGRHLRAGAADRQRTVKVPVIAAGGIGDGQRHRRGASRSARPACRSAPPISSVPRPRSRRCTGRRSPNPAARPSSPTCSPGVPRAVIVNRFMREQGPINDAAPNFPLARPPSRRCGEGASEGVARFLAALVGAGGRPAAGDRRAAS